MKLLTTVIYILAVLPVGATDPQPFAPIRLQLELPHPTIPIPVTGVRLDLPIGPVPIDYGIPKPSNLHRDNNRYWPNLDAPGRGYQEQKQRLLTNDRNA